LVLECINTANAEIKYAKTSLQGTILTIHVDFECDSIKSFKELFHVFIGAVFAMDNRISEVKDEIIRDHELIKYAQNAPSKWVN